MIARQSGAFSVTALSEREVVITRVFDAPRQLVFAAMTQPEHVRRWYGPRSLTMTICEIDLRVGGAWRYVLAAPDGSEHGFSGVYRAITPPAGLVSTEGYEAMPGHDYLVTLTLDERDGQTTSTSHLRYASVEDRDGHLNAGMEGGARESMERLEQLLAAMG